MREIIITANDAGRRLDRFLRKYLPEASLGEVYKAIRKDVKVDGKRRDESYILNEGEVLALYLTDEALDRYGAPEDESGSAGSGRFGAAGMDDAAARAGGGPRARSGPESAGSRRRAKRTFGIVYEDDNVLMANKPFGLLTHGDSREKKEHLANQVKDYLIETGAFDPRSEKVFVPAPVNRLDRNTTGVVLFGKTSEAMRELNRMIREDDIRKFYLTIACGVIDSELHLGGSLIKDELQNKVRVIGITDAGDGSTDTGDTDAAAAAAAGLTAADAPDGITAADPAGAKTIETIVRPLQVLTFGPGLTATLCEVELVTGRSHQIRAHLASIGHPLIGDSKYAGQSAKEAGRMQGAKASAGIGQSGPSSRSGRSAASAVNSYVKDRFGLTTQLLHACRVEFLDSAADSESLGYLAERCFDAPAPWRFKEILAGLGGREIY